MDQVGMSFRVTREDFSEAVAWVARTLPSRPATPVLAGVLLEAGVRGLTIAGFDYAPSARTTISAAVAEPGTILVSGRLLADITKSLPPQPVEVSFDGTRLHITGGS